MKPGGQHKLGGVTAAWPAVGWGRENLILGLGEGFVQEPGHSTEAGSQRGVKTEEIPHFRCFPSHISFWSLPLPALSGSSCDDQQMLSSPHGADSCRTNMKGQAEHPTR